MRLIVLFLGVILMLGHSTAALCMQAPPLQNRLSMAVARKSVAAVEACLASQDLEAVFAENPELALTLLSSALSSSGELKLKKQHKKIALLLIQNEIVYKHITNKTIYRLIVHLIQSEAIPAATWIMRRPFLSEKLSTHDCFTICLATELLMPLHDESCEFVEDVEDIACTEDNKDI